MSPDELLKKYEFIKQEEQNCLVFFDSVHFVFMWVAGALLLYNLQLKVITEINIHVNINFTFNTNTQCTCMNILFVNNSEVNAGPFFSQIYSLDGRPKQILEEKIL